METQRLSDISQPRSDLPRAWVVHDARTTVPVTGLSRESRNKAMQEILYAADGIWHDTTQVAYDPRRIAWVGNDDAPALRGYLSGQSPRPSEAVKVTYPNPQQAVLEVTLESPGIVILADVYYPGWELTIDGKPAPNLDRVNGSMRGAAVPAQFHRLVFTYVPQSFRIGAVVSVAGPGVPRALWGGVCHSSRRSGVGQLPLWSQIPRHSRVIAAHRALTLSRRSRRSRR